MSARWLAYRLFNIAGKLLPTDERERLLRVLRTGDPEECVPVDEVVWPAASSAVPVPTPTEEAR